MTPNGSDPSPHSDAPRSVAPIPIVVGVIAALVRIPAFAAGRHLSFDDGVYGASALAMRNGGVPFRDVFSSQGPLFLPLVYLGDALGLHTSNAPRVLAVLSGALSAGFVAAIAGRISGRRADALIAGLLAAISGALWWTTGPLTSDGPTIAFGCAALWAAYRYRSRPGSGGAALVGALLGAAVAIKLVLAFPVIVVAGLLMLTTNRRRDPLLAATMLVLVPVVSALAVGFSRFWDQVVRYHLESEVGTRNPFINLRKLATTLVDRDLILIVLAGIACIALLVTAWRQRNRPTEPVPWLDRVTAGLTPIGLWLALTIAVLAVQHPLWRNHVAYVIPPLAISVGVVAGRGRAPALAMITAVILLFPYQLLHTSALWNPGPYRDNDARIARVLRGLPGNALVVSDEPGLAWRTGHRAPDNLVDTSQLRIESPIPGIRITTATVVDAARSGDVCAVVSTSEKRFGALTGLDDRLQNEGYVRELRTGTDLGVWVRPECPTPDPTSR